MVLVFHGVDTFATILLNGHEIGETSNMFLKYTFDVTKYLEVSILLFHIIILLYIFNHFSEREFIGNFFFFTC